MLPGWQRWAQTHVSHSNTQLCLLVSHKSTTSVAAGPKRRCHMAAPADSTLRPVGLGPGFLRPAKCSKCRLLKWQAPCHSNPVQRRVLLHTAYGGTHPNVPKCRAHEGACHQKQATVANKGQSSIKPPATGTKPETKGSRNAEANGRRKNKNKKRTAAEKTCKAKTTSMQRQTKSRQHHGRSKRQAVRLCKTKSSCNKPLRHARHRKTKVKRSPFSS